MFRNKKPFYFIFEHNIENIVINNFLTFLKNITTAIVGPSGSESLISLACLNLLPESSKIKVSGNIFLETRIVF